MRPSAIVRIGGHFAALSLACAAADGCARGNLAGDQASGDLIESGAGFALDASGSLPSDDASSGLPPSDDASSGLPPSDDASSGNLPDEAMVDDALGTAGDGASPMPSANANTGDANASNAALDSGPQNSAPSDGGFSIDAQSDAAGLRDAALDSAVSDSGQDAARCINDLSNIGTGDFQISFSMTGSQTGRTALVNQRRICYFEAFWDIRVSDGALLIETDQNSQSNWVLFTTKGPLVNDGQVHTVLVRRSAETVTAYIDGIASGSFISRASFGPLAPIAIGTDPCDNTSMDSTVAFTGKVTNLCITIP
jgi:hypothetical protein